MKWFLTIVLYCLLIPAFPQEDPGALARELTLSCKTEKEKVTKIFRWITNNISYKTTTIRRAVIGPASLKNFRSEVDDDSPLKPLNERVSETVLLRRTAICDGYARLFTTLCDFAGICSEVIVGYAKGGANKPVQKFGVNHYWNAVMIDGNWYLLDPTWASGYMSAQGDEFIREYDNDYFLSPPDKFIRDHYPDDARWTLLPDSKVPEEFRFSPFKQKSFTKYHITSFYPAKGVIEAFVGDTIRLQLETAMTEKGRDICPDLLIDSAIFSHSSSWVFLRPELADPTAWQSKHYYNYTIASPDIQWLYLLYNNDLVLRYKINVRKRRG
jgi:hypothetical protein